MLLLLLAMKMGFLKQKFGHFDRQVDNYENKAVLLRAIYKTC